MRDRGVSDPVVALWHGHDERVMRQHYYVVHAAELADAGSVLGDVMRGAS